MRNGIAFIVPERRGRGEGRRAEREDARAVEGGGPALREGGEGVGRCEEELRAEAVVGGYGVHVGRLCRR